MILTFIAGSAIFSLPVIVWAITVRYENYRLRERYENLHGEFTRLQRRISGYEATLERFTRREHNRQRTQEIQGQMATALEQRQTLLASLSPNIPGEWEPNRMPSGMGIGPFLPRRAPYPRPVLPEYTLPGGRSQFFRNFYRQQPPPPQPETLFGHIWTEDIHVSHRVPPQTTLTLAPAEYIGAIPVRQDITVLPADQPRELRLGVPVNDTLANIQNLIQRLNSQSPVLSEQPVSPEENLDLEPYYIERQYNFEEV